MALRKILTQGDPALTKTCRPVEKFDRKLSWLLDDMKETLANAGGVGLAAPQIGILRRVVVVEDDQENLIELVNPVIVEQSGEQEGWEGCLSVPGQYGWVERPNVVTVRAQDRKGNFFEVSGEELVARCFCHELEHLDGHLFVEHTDELYTPEEIDAMEAEEEKPEEREKAGRRRGKKK
ncbi:MAG: peptide deformylase [Clostridiales bacterium]|nr:peptide deformylase [Clostridiales bacterium]